MTITELTTELNKSIKNHFHTCYPSSYSALSHVLWRVCLDLKIQCPEGFKIATETLNKYNDELKKGDW